ncbi:response regulator [Sphingomonas sp.]|uniref:response regulator transcription factor n=1 Tax=Sphingomonas sp. TaxID=28214 RepID=UPI001B003F54|nr:response regulator [Sphingomonas sp.]MBO9714271.1 response regulator [Sphingomonas sp.]
MTEAPVIAVVDDDESIRTGVARLLRAAGYGVRVFDSAEAFLADDANPATAALVTDIQMPGMSGLDLQAMVNRERPELGVLMMTGYPDALTRQRALDAGARCVLSKPFDADELLAELETAIRGS